MAFVWIFITWHDEYQAVGGEGDICDIQYCAAYGRRDKDPNNTDPVVKLARSAGFSPRVKGRP